MPMTPAQQDTACALSKHPRFQWRRGMSMLRDAPGKQDNLKLEYVCQSAPNSDRMLQSELFSDSIPDLADPATVGALAHIGRELYKPRDLVFMSHPMVVCGIYDKNKRTNAYSSSLFDEWQEMATGQTEGEAWGALILGLT